MRRLVCVVEGRGEVRAAPVLCNRVLRRLLDVHDWYVDEDPVRLPRSQLVDERVRSPLRPPRGDQVDRALRLAAGRNPGAVLLLCDADDDCPVAWGTKVPAHLPGRPEVLVRGVMANREFESWLLWSFDDEARARVNARDPEVAPRGAKSALADLHRGYQPSTHQVDLVRKLDIHAVWRRSRSFRRLVSAVAQLTGAAGPDASP